jgi:hypothetical protein
MLFPVKNKFPNRYWKQLENNVLFHFTDMPMHGASIGLKWSLNLKALLIQRLSREISPNMKFLDLLAQPRLNFPYS